MFSKFKPMLVSLGLAAFLTGAATAQNVGGYSHVQQTRISNPNPYIYNNNANNGNYNYNGNRYVRNRNNVNYRNSRDNYNNTSRVVTRGYSTNGNNRYYNNNNNGYYNNNNDPNRGINLGPVRINY